MPGRRRSAPGWASASPRCCPGSRTRPSWGARPWPPMRLAPASRRRSSSHRWARASRRRWRARPSFSWRRPSRPAWPWRISSPAAGPSRWTRPVARDRPPADTQRAMPHQPAVNYAVFFVTRYRSLEEALAKEPALIAAHRARTRAFHDRGTLLMAGAFLNTPDEPLGTMAILTTRDAAEDYARGDPF